MPGHPAEEPGSQPRVSRCLSAAGIRFLGILSRQWLSAPLTIGLPRHDQLRGPWRGFRVSHA